jgi:histone-lysine N-methyltransferase MLL3
LRKNGNELNETDAGEMEKIAKELPGLQKQLDQARKQSRQHNLLMQDYRNKQQKRQQMMGLGPNTPVGNMTTQQSPLGAASSSPLHSTPQSPMLSPSPSLGGPSPSPLMQNSPMASPLTPSPGPSNTLSQTSPRGNPGVHVMDDTPFSPNADVSGRQLSSQNIGPGRMQGQHHVAQLRMGSPGMSGHPVMIQQQGGMNVNMGGKPGNAGHMMVRGINPVMVQQMQSQQRSMMETQHGMQRMRSLVPQDQLR